MDAETVSRIFEPFFTTKSADRGTGLGLSTVHGIVTQSGGAIRVQSEPGRGTRFEIILPRASDEVDPPRKTRARRAPGRGSEVVLVVDDDAVLRGLVSEILQTQGYAVIQAGDGESAWKILEEGRQEIHAVVTDVVMPRLSGRALAERILAARPDLTILFMSGYLGENIEALRSLLGPKVGFVQKPFDPEILLAKLREALDATSSEAA
jgi:two-component system, cell cycle sensor histidine kinase and response regulator CckA